MASVLYRVPGGSRPPPPRPPPHALPPPRGVLSYWDSATRGPCGSWPREVHVVHSPAHVPVLQMHGNGSWMPALLLMKVGDIFSPQGQDVTDSCFHFTGDSLSKIAAVPVLDVKHLLIDLPHGHVAPATKATVRRQPGGRGHRRPSRSWWQTCAG